MKTPIIFADIPAGADVVVGPQAFPLATEFGIHPAEAGFRLAWAKRVTGFNVHFENSTETPWHPAEEWAAIHAHFEANLHNERPSVGVCLGIDK